MDFLGQGTWISYGWLAGWLAGCFAAWLADWLVGRLADWPAGYVAGWLADSLPASGSLWQPARPAGRRRLTLIQK